MNEGVYIVSVRVLDMTEVLGVTFDLEIAIQIWIDYCYPNRENYTPYINGNIEYHPLIK